MAHPKFGVLPGGSYWLDQGFNPFSLPELPSDDGLDDSFDLQLTQGLSFAALLELSRHPPSSDVVVPAPLQPRAISSLIQPDAGERLSVRGLVPSGGQRPGQSDVRCPSLKAPVLLAPPPSRPPPPGPPPATTPYAPSAVQASPTPDPVRGPQSVRAPVLLAALRPGIAPPPRCPALTPLDGSPPQESGLSDQANDALPSEPDDPDEVELPPSFLCTVRAVSLDGPPPLGGITPQASAPIAPSPVAPSPIAPSPIAPSTPLNETPPQRSAARQSPPSTESISPPTPPVAERRQAPADVPVTRRATTGDLPVVRADRYGFELAESPDEVSEAERRLQQQGREQELEDERKWVKMMGQWATFAPKNFDKVEARVRKGIPDCCRSQAWPLLLELESDKQGQTRASVDDIIRMGKPSCADAIQRDLARTLPTMVMLRDARMRESLRRVMWAYANLDPDLGYCQGMAWPAALLVCYLDETRAFWCFMRLMNGTKFSFRKVFMDNFEGLHALTAVWDLLLQEKFKRIAAKLKQIQVFPEMYTTSWFLPAFQSIEFHPELRLRLFDRYVTCGCRSLLSFGLVIVSANRDELMNGSLNDCLLILQHPEKCECSRNWRTMLVKFDKMWIPQREYERLFKKANLQVFN